MDSKLEKTLPDGTSLVAEIWDEPDYPGVRISLKNPDGSDEVICFAEYNSTKPQHKRLCVSVYSSGHDEPVYYESYRDIQAPSQNV